MNTQGDDATESMVAGDIPEPPIHHIKAGSTTSSFKLEILLPATSFFTTYGEGTRHATRGMLPIQPGGRLILFDTVLMDKHKIQVMLTLHHGQSSGYRVAGELFGRGLPSLLKARLVIGDNSYDADVQDGLVEFHDVVFVDQVKHIVFCLSTLDQWP